MWQNNLHGEIPAELSSLKLLGKLILDYNALSGMIPDGLVNCTSLNWISLASNWLTGSIPIWIGNLKKLEILILRNNSFNGSIPPGLGDYLGLLYLDLSSNQLSGSIPPALAKLSGDVVDLMIYGWPVYTKDIDDESPCHRKTVTLEFNGIRYTDMIWIPAIRDCHSRYRVTRNSPAGQDLTNNVSMVLLDLSYNQLNGHIPTEFSTMQFLMVLHLEHNHLTGPLPQGMGHMKSLLQLDLSHNMLEGSIPPSLSDLLLSLLDLSNNQLSGPIPEEGSLFTFPEYAYENNSGLCGLPLPPCNSKSTSNLDEAPHLSTIDHECSQIWWIVLGILFCTFFITGFVIGQFL